MKSIIKNILRSVLPESKLKEQFKCFIYNLTTSEFSLRYFDDLYHVNIDGIRIKFTENPYYLLRDQSLYFKYYNPRAGDVIIDAGAYIGTVAVYLAKKVGETGKVIAFEPDPNSFKRLMAHIKINDIENIVPINKGLWEEEKVLTFNSNLELGSSFIETQNGTQKNIIKVPVTSIDKVFQKLGISRLDFIKMDIEGSEIQAINGGYKILSTNKVKAALATYHLVDGQPTFHKVEKQLLDLNYNVSTEFEGETITYAK